MRGSVICTLLLACALLGGCAASTSTVPQTGNEGSPAKSASRHGVFEHEQGRCGDEDACRHLRLVEPLVALASNGVTLKHGAPECENAKVPRHMDADDAFPLGATSLPESTDAGLETVTIFPMPDPCAPGSGGGGTAAAAPVTTMGLSGGGSPPPPPGSVASDYVIFALHVDADGDHLRGHILADPVYEFGSTLYFDPGSQFDADAGQYAFYLATKRHDHGGDHDRRDHDAN